jgi:hypothetical protein
MEVGALETCANAGSMAIAPKIPSRFVIIRNPPLSRKKVSGLLPESRPVYTTSASWVQHGVV